MPTAADLEAILAACRTGQLPETVALMRLLLDFGSAAAVRERLAALADPAAKRLLKLLADNPQAEAQFRAIAASGLDHGASAGSIEAGIAAIRAAFDRSARAAPDAAVALYSLGNPALLAAATAEIVTLLRDWGVLGAERMALDLGCGTGRMTQALAGALRFVAGVDIAPAMLAEARRRCAALANVGFAAVSGRDLAAIANRSVDLVLAIDVFPYLVQADLRLAETHIAEIARVLRPGGDAVILNLSYRGDLARDRLDAAAFAEAARLAPQRLGEQPLSLWDGVAFHLQKPVVP